MPSPSVIAIILNWNKYDDVVICIESLLASSHPFERIVLADNGSTDDSFARLKQKFDACPSVVFIDNGSNLGFAAGMNAAYEQIAELRPDYILLMNNDAKVAPDCLETLLDAARKEERPGLIGPTIYYTSRPETVWHGGGRYNKWKCSVTMPNKDQPLPASVREPVQCGFLTGCVLLVSTEAWEACSGFDEDFFFYSEDLDLCWRIRDAGYSILYVPRSSAWHKLIGVAEDRSTPFTMYNFGRSLALLIRKHYGVLHKIYAALFIPLVMSPFRMYQCTKGSTPRKSIVAWWKGLYAGLRYRLSDVDDPNTD
ncbi:MAG: hypothetical protein CL946_08630 [Ectothiorhodospiraceae bacterium]|nr:hypothetical protein [Ectothiorhodospiraceae bacterium]